MSNFEQELTTQPEMWRRANELGSTATLFPPGARVAFVGCGTSLYVAQAAATYRNEQLLGESDAFPASEMPPGRKYDAVVAISRSGTTTEVVEAMTALVSHTRTLAITAVEESPLADIVADKIVLSFADEQSIVQTRFATSALSFLLANFGWDVEASANRAEVFLREPPEEIGAAEHFVFLGRGVAAALANEAALKFHEVLGAWTESYPTMEYRHGPISVATERSLVWILDDAETRIDEEIAVTGALWSAAEVIRLPASSECIVPSSRSRRDEALIPIIPAFLCDRSCWIATEMTVGIAGAFLALDIGGTKIASAVGEADGTLRHCRTLPTEADRGARAVLDSAVDLATEVLSRSGRAVVRSAPSAFQWKNVRAMRDSVQKNLRLMISPDAW